MVKLYFNNNQTNAEILLNGFWNHDLPDVLNINSLCPYLEDVIEYINNKKCDFYSQKDTGFIYKFKNIQSPSYIVKPGVEAIVYYNYKKNKSLREMQVPNLLHYLAFLYNSLHAFGDVFEKLYLDESNQKYVENSNSFPVFSETFYIDTGYDEEEVEFGTFTDENNKTHSRISFDCSKNRILKEQGAYIYKLKMDIESFYPNIYTHYLEKIKDYEPYKSLCIPDDYFCFLDEYNMKVNNNQTKGIPTGVFSSQISAELCMLCVDFEIRKQTKDLDIGYIRYVDDLSFYSDSKDELEKVKSIVQKILNNYRLRINGNKTEITKNIYEQQQIYYTEIKNYFPFLFQDSSKTFNMDDYKRYVSQCLTKGRISQIKSLLTTTYKFLQKKQNEEESEKLKDIILNELFNYLLQLSFEEVLLSVHIYKILNLIIENSENQERLIKTLRNKTKYVNLEHSDTLMQIWHYYILSKNIPNSEFINLLVSESIENPIIITMSVKEGEKENKKLIDYIIRKFSFEDSEWKSHIMFSKWWLPLFKIYLVDGYNYYSFYNSKNFPRILSLFKYIF